MPRVPDDARQLEDLLSSGCASGFSQVQRYTLKELASPDGWRFSRAVDVCGLLALRPCFHVVDYLLVFLKRPEAAALNFRVAQYPRVGESSVPPALGLPKTHRAF
jgi:hypothetical protein